MKKVLGIMTVLVFGASFAQASSTLTCESIDHRFRRCYSDEPITRARLEEQLSHSDCNQGDTWGYDRDSVWVTDGCRGRFRLDHGSSNQDVTREISCESNGNDRRCYVDGTILHIDLVDEYSSNDCHFGRTWAWDHDYLLVTHDCAGLFRIRYRPYNRL